MHKYLLLPIVFFAVACSRIIRPLAPHLPPSTIDSVPLPDSRIDVPIRIDLDSITAPWGLSLSGALLHPGDRALARAGELVRNPLIRKIAQPYWAKLFQPIRVGDIGYLSMDPSEVRLEDLTASVHLLSATLGVTARPVFSLVNPGPPATTPPLPTFSHVSATGFNVYVDARIQYATLNALLKARLENKRISLGSTGYIIIKRAELYGEGNHHLLVRVDFKGRLHADAWPGYRGRLYFTCLPLYDQDSGVLYVTELKFDTYTRANLLAKAGDMILNSMLTTFLHDQLRFDLTPQIEGVRSQLNAAINKPIAPAMNLSGEISSLSLSGILPVTDCVLMRFAASGHLAISAGRMGK